MHTDGSATPFVTGNGGKQILIEDPSGNPIELFQPSRDDYGRESALLSEADFPAGLYKKR